MSRTSWIALIALCSAACTSSGDPREPSARAAQPSDAVLVHDAGPIHFDSDLVELGPPLPPPPIPARVATIEALTAPVFAPLSGRIAETLVGLGARVKRGDRLVEVRSAELPLLNQDVESSISAVRAKEAEVERLGRMVETGVGSQHELLLARAELERLRIAGKAAQSRRAALEVAESKNAASYFVLAPRDGTIVQLDAMAGKVVGPERNLPLATVASIDELFVIGDVPLRHTRGLKAGARAIVRSGPDADDSRSGTLELVSEVVDPERQTVPVRVRVDNRERSLRPNAYVELLFEPSAEERVLLVPTRAVVSDGARSVVFVEGAPGKFERRPVTLGRQSTELSEVRSGLSAGTRVVVSHALLLLNMLSGEG